MPTRECTNIRTKFMNVKITVPKHDTVMIRQQNEASLRRDGLQLIFKYFEQDILQSIYSIYTYEYNR